MSDAERQALVGHENARWTQIFQEEISKEKDSPQPEYSSEWWRRYYEEMIGYTRAYLCRYRSPRILEAGSGSGKASILLGKSFNRTLFDISPVALGYARHLAAKFGAQDVSFVDGDLFAMPFQDGSFEFAWNIGVIEHYSPERAQAILAEMFRVTSPGGTVAFGVPNFLSGPIIKARLLNIPLFRRFDGYRLDTERRYGADCLLRIAEAAADAAGREIEWMDRRVFGDPLPIETPAAVLRMFGPVLRSLRPFKFLTFLLFRIR